MQIHTPYGEVRYGWLKLLYGLTAFLGILVGGIMLFGPEKLARKVVGIPFMLPDQDPIIFGALAGIWFTIGLLCLLALRSPIKFLPLLMLQCIYKFFWFACVFFPLILTNSFPEWGWASVVGNAFWMTLDIIAVPWWYCMLKDSDRVELPEPAPTRETARSAQALA